MRPLIFDFDGVLADTMTPWSEFLSRSLHISADSARRHLIRGGYRSSQDGFAYRLIKNYFFNRLRMTYQLRQDLLFSDRLAEIKLLPNPKAILTRNDSHLCRDVLGPEINLFEHIIGRNDTKTKILGIHQLLADPVFAAEPCLFFTDTVGDVHELSQILDINQIYAVSWGYHSREILEKVLPADQILDDFNKLTDILQL